MFLSQPYDRRYPMPAPKTRDGRIEAGLFPSVVCEMIDLADLGAVSEDLEVHVVLHLVMCDECTQRLAGFRGLN